MTTTPRQGPKSGEPAAPVGADRGRRDAGEAAQLAAEAHLDACMEALDGEGDSPSVYGYDGCTTCDVRETLSVAWPIIVADCAALLELAGHPQAAALLHAEADRMTPLHGEGVHA